MQYLKQLCVVLAVLTLAACSDSSDLGAGKTGKSFTVTGHSYDQVWDASLTALTQVRGTQSLEINRSVEITKKDKKAGIINAASGMSLWSWGDVMGVFINPAHDAPSYKIDVESLSTYKMGYTSNNWEDEIIAAIKQNLQRGKEK
jgi:hypothetical protein